MKKKISILLFAIVLFASCNNTKTNDNATEKTVKTGTECKPTLVNVVSFEDKDNPDGNSYSYVAKFKLSLLDENGKVIFDSGFKEYKDFNPDKITISTDFKNIKGIDSSKRQSVFYEITIERTNKATSKVETINIPEKSGSAESTFPVSTYINALGGKLDADNSNNITHQKVQFYFNGKAKKTLPGQINPPIKTDPIPPKP